MHARVVGELRMEGGDEEPPVARQHRMAVELGEHVDARPRLLEPRRADEDGAQRLGALADVEVRLEAPHLAAEGVPPRGVVAEAEMVAIEDDHPGARPEDRAAERADGFVEVVEPHQPSDRGRLPAGDDEPVEPVELLGEPHLDRLGAEAPQHCGVLPEVPLHGEDADPQRRLHAFDGNAAQSGAGAGIALRRRPSRPSRTSQKPRRPNASAGDHGLTPLVCPAETALAISVGEPTR